MMSKLKINNFFFNKNKVDCDAIFFWKQTFLHYFPVIFVKLL